LKDLLLLPLRMLFLSAFLCMLFVSSLGTPIPDKVVIVWMENHDYSDIVKNADAPWINKHMVQNGTTYSASSVVPSPSYPNYIAFFSGSNQGVKDDSCIDGAPFKSKNLYTELAKVGKKFAWYSEDLSKMGSDACKNGNYAEKHNPTTVFSNVPKEANKPYSMFPQTPSGWAKMEDVVCISPNQVNDMHDTDVQHGDAWMKTNMANYLSWAESNNGLLIMIVDEGSPIPFIIAGQNVKQNYASKYRTNHYDLLKTVLRFWSAPRPFPGNAENAHKLRDYWIGEPDA